MLIIWALFAILFVACGTEAQRVIHPTPEEFRIDDTLTALAAPVEAPVEPMHLALANDSIFFSTEDGSIWHIPHNQTPRQIQAASDDGSLPLWSVSPDGNSLAILRRILDPSATAQAHPDIELWLFNSRTGHMRHVLNLQPPTLPLYNATVLNTKDLYNQVASQTPRWSPDNRQLAFVSAHTGKLDVYVAQTDGLVRQVSDNEALEAQLTWSPDGDFLAFTSYQQDAYSLIVSEPSSERILYQGQAPHEGQQINSITWLDEQHLALGSAYGSLCNTDISLLNWQQQQQLSIFSQSNACVSTPQWGQQVQTLAMSVSQAGNNGLFLWKWGDQAAQQQSAGLALDLAWNPQGDTLAYRQISETQEELVLWNSDQSYRMQSNGWPAQWSENGDYIAVGSQIFTSQARLVFEPSQENTSPFGWYQHGFVYSQEQPDLHNQLTLWRWDKQDATLITSLSLP
jgi:dipeptidyl aminopeptidase/acylaminoacyl peptidase